MQNVRSAMEALLQRHMTVQDLRNDAKPQKSKLKLKREDAAKLERLLVYLDGMAFKDSDTFGKDYNYVVGLITHLNKTYKHKVRTPIEDVENEEWDEELDDELGDESEEEEKFATSNDLPESADPTRVA